MVGFERGIEHFFHRIRIEIARRNNHQTDRIRDHMNECVVFHEFWIFTEDRAAFRAFNMRFKSNRAIDAKDLQKLRHKKDRVEIILFFILRAFEHFAEAAGNALNRVNTITNKHSANSRAPDGGELRRRRVNDRLKITAVDHEHAEHAPKNNHKADDTKHKEPHFTRRPSSTGLSCRQIPTHNHRPRALHQRNLYKKYAIIVISPALGSEITPRSSRHFDPIRRWGGSL